jgi:hypothetical protein
MLELQASYETLTCEVKVQVLFTALTSQSSSVSEEGRQLAAVMVRRVITNEFTEFFQKVK